MVNYNIQEKNLTLKKSTSDNVIVSTGDLEAEAGPELDDGVGAGKEGEEEEGEVKQATEEGKANGKGEGEGEVKNEVEEGEQHPMQAEAIEETAAEPQQVNNDSSVPDESEPASTAITVDEKEFEPVYD